jgi:hypothetical protein
VIEVSRYQLLHRLIEPELLDAGPDPKIVPPRQAIVILEPATTSLC